MLGNRDDSEALGATMLGNRDDSDSETLGATMLGNRIVSPRSHHAGEQG